MPASFVFHRDCMEDGRSTVKLTREPRGRLALLAASARLVRLPCGMVGHLRVARRSALVRCHRPARPIGQYELVYCAAADTTNLFRGRAGGTSPSHDPSHTKGGSRCSGQEIAGRAAGLSEVIRRRSFRPNTSSSRLRTRWTFSSPICTKTARLGEQLPRDRQSIAQVSQVAVDAQFSQVSRKARICSGCRVAWSTCRRRPRASASRPASSSRT